MEIREIDIHTLLPQQPPFVMVGCLTHYDNVLTVTETTIAEDNIFVEDGRFTAPGILENIAQTCAARIGYYNVYVKKDNVIRIGFIGAMKDIAIKRLPKAGETLRTEIRVQQEIFGMILAEAAVYSGDGTVAEGEIKIALDGGN